MRRFLGCVLGTLLVITIPATSAHADPGHGAKGFGAPTPFESHHKSHHHSPYPGTVPTFTGVFASPAKVGKPETISVDVAPFGWAKPTGTVEVTVTGPGGFTDTESVTVDSGWQKVTTAPIPTAGLYSVKAVYTPTSGSVFAPSTGYSGFFAITMPWWWWPWF